jgi:hypothetical protein
MVEPQAELQVEPQVAQQVELQAEPQAELQAELQVEPQAERQAVQQVELQAAQQVELQAAQQVERQAELRTEPPVVREPHSKKKPLRLGNHNLRGIFYSSELTSKEAFFLFSNAHFLQVPVIWIR